MKNSPKYFWEFARRNEEYVKDWQNYFKDHDRDLMKKLFLKWGIASFPESDNFELRWEEVPREKEGEGGRSDLFMANIKNHISALMQIFPEVIEDFPQTSLSHEILIGEKDEDKLDAPFDKEKNIYFLENEEGKKERVFYLAEYNISDYSIKEINQLTEENIPDEITLTIHNFKGFCREQQTGRTVCQERIVKKIKEQLRKWGSAAKELGIAKKDTRLKGEESEYLDDLLDVWDRFDNKESPEKIAKEKWFDKGVYKKTSSNRSSESERLDLEKEAYHYELVRKYGKEGLRFKDIKKRAREETEEEYPPNDFIATAIDKTNKYRKRAKEFIENPHIFVEG